MGMMTRLLVIGIHLLVTSQISYSLVLLSANIEDVKRLAMQFVPEPLAEQIASLLSKATLIKTPSISAETIRNGLAKLSYINWNTAEQRGTLESHEEYRNHISVKRGRDIPEKEQATLRSTYLDSKKNYVYDYALKQWNTKKPNFEWEKGANYDIAVLTNQAPLFDTTTRASKRTTKANLRIIGGVTKKTTLKRPHSKLQQRPKKEKTFYPLHSVHKTEKDVHKPIREKYSNIIKLLELGKKDSKPIRQVQRPGHKIVIKEIRKPVKDNPKYKDPTKLDIKLNLPKPPKHAKEQSKEENVVDTYSDVSSDTNKVEEEEESSDSNRINDSAEPVGSTRFADYDKPYTVQFQSEKSIYTKDVLATSGPVELLRAKVNFLDSSEDNSLNEENKKYFKQYDNGPHSDLRRHLEEKSSDERTTTTTTEAEVTKVENATEVNEISEVDTQVNDVTAGENNNTSWYGGATVYNNVQTEQVTEDATIEKSK